MRITGMGTTGVSGISPRDGASEFDATQTMKSGQSKISPKASKSFRQRRSTKTRLPKSSELTAEAAEKSSADLVEATELPVDIRTGQQLYENELVLTPMQKLQLRIAQERGLDIFRLKGGEYDTLKEFMKLEERKVQLNTFDDFFNA
jgi:hypothetical protein